ncbi:MAG TPA: MFS transporter [Trueperaceae bacterium]|nr:MFS transporter [Trueperaceae bacterium]
MHTTTSLPGSDATRLSAAFRLIAWSNLCAQFSEQVALAAAPLVAVLLLAAGPAETGWLQAVQTLPFLLLSLPAGVAADRISRRHLLVGSEALRSVALTALLVLLLTGSLNLPLLAALGFVGAVGTVCYSVTTPALIPTLVVRAQLSRANRWLELVRSIAYTSGPAVGGLIVGRTGAAGAYLLAALLSLAATGLLAGLPLDARRHLARRHVINELKEGAVFVTRHSLLRPILLTACLFNTAWFVLQAVFVVHAVDHLGRAHNNLNAKAATMVGSSAASAKPSGLTASPSK